MTQDGILFTQWFFSEFWRFFNSWHIPGTSMTPAAFFLTCIIIPLALKFILSVVSGIRSGSGAFDTVRVINKKIK